MILNRSDTKSREERQKIQQGLVEYVYDNAKFTLIASLLCSSLILYGLYSPEISGMIIPWYIAILVINLTRYILILLYFRDPHREARLMLWKNLFIIGTIFAGLSWGYVSYFIFPAVDDFQKTLTILIIVGVTSGGAPALAAVKTAAFAFIWLTIVPLIVRIEDLNNTLSLFAFTAMVFVIYLTIFSLRMHHMIKNILSLQYENLLLLKKLKHLATHDPLTNLDNARLFYENLDLAITRAKLQDALVVLLYIDLDKFKDVNDLYGHQVGDKLLKYVAKVIQNQIRPNDFVARMGGDEFAVILENMHDKKLIIDIAKRICTALENETLIEGFKIKISASIGISIYPTDAGDIATLVRTADEAMYHIKKHGTNNYAFSQNKSTERTS